MPPAELTSKKHRRHPELPQDGGFHFSKRNFAPTPVRNPSPSCNQDTRFPPESEAQFLKTQEDQGRIPVFRLQRARRAGRTRPLTAHFGVGSQSVWCEDSKVKPFSLEKKHSAWLTRCIWRFSLYTVTENDRYPAGAGLMPPYAADSTANGQFDGLVSGRFETGSSANLRLR